MLAGTQHCHTPTAVDDALVAVATEPDPVLDLALDPGEIDLGQVAGGRRGGCRELCHDRQFGSP
jgi:hypothetical protein